MEICMVRCSFYRFQIRVRHLLPMHLVWEHIHVLIALTNWCSSTLPFLCAGQRNAILWDIRQSLLFINDWAHRSILVFNSVQMHQLLFSDICDFIMAWKSKNKSIVSSIIIPYSCTMHTMSSVKLGCGALLKMTWLRLWSCVFYNMAPTVFF